MLSRSMLTKIVVLTILLLSVIPIVSVADDTQATDRIERGKELAFDRRKGNCLACHAIDGATWLEITDRRCC